jgi:hypothetical protein
VNPAAATEGVVLNYTNKLHKAHYFKASATLYPDDSKERFDLTEGSLQNFLNRIRDRAIDCRLSTVEVPRDMNNPAAGRVNIITHHTELGYDRIRAYAATFVSTPTRACQDDDMLYQCLAASLTQDAYDTINSFEGEYIIQGTRCGVLFLWVIIRESAAAATIAPDTIRKELAHSDAKFRELKYDVQEFNQWVNLKVKQLRQHGEESTDLRTHLFTAYASASDTSLVKYIEGLKDDLRDRRITITPTELMSKAKNKADELDKERRFKALGGPTDTKDEQILALEAKLEALAKKFGTGKRNNNGNGGGNRSGKGGNRQGKQGKKGKKDPNAKPFPKELIDAGAPDDTSKPRTIDGVDYWWCTHHNKWGKHKTSECKAKDGNGSNNNRSNNRQNRTIRAVAAAIEGQSDSD